LNDVLLRAQAKSESSCNDLPIREFVGDRVSRAQRALKKRSRYASRNETAHEEDLQDVRKTGKKLTYLLELFSTRYQGRTRPHRKRVRVRANKLGQFNDIVASETSIRGTSFNYGPSEVVQHRGVFKSSHLSLPRPPALSAAVSLNHLDRLARPQ